jgi:hypothetical protein
MVLLVVMLKQIRLIMSLAPLLLVMLLLLLLWLQLLLVAEERQARHAMLRQA